MKATVKWCIFPAVLLTAVLAAAQPPIPGPASGGQQAPFRQGGLEKWKDGDIREIVEMVMMVRLSKELELDDEQTVVLVRRFDGLKEKWTQARRQRQRLVDDLKKGLANGADEAAIEEKLARLVDFDVNLEREKLGILQEAGQGLSVTQKAKLYVFVGEFEERLRNMVRRAREAQRPKAMPTGDGQRPPQPMLDPGDEIHRIPVRGRTDPAPAQPDRAVPGERPVHRGRDGTRQRGGSEGAAPSNERPRSGDPAQRE
jgi:hypothetical protein